LIVEKKNFQRGWDEKRRDLHARSIGIFVFFLSR